MARQGPTIETSPFAKTAPEGQSDEALHRQEDLATETQGDEATSRQGDKETEPQGDLAPKVKVGVYLPSDLYVALEAAYAQARARGERTSKSEIVAKALRAYLDT